MDDLERKLVEINNKLLDMYKQKANRISQENRKIMGMTDLGPGNDIVIIDDININIDSDNEETNNKKSTVIADDFKMKSDNYFVAIKSEKEVNLVLPIEFKFNNVFVVKLEKGSPKVIIKTEDKSLIDGEETLTLQSANEVIQLIRCDKNWSIISYM